MAEAPDRDRGRVEEVDWDALFPAQRVLGSFRLAIGPARLLLALALVVGVYAGGRVLDAVYWNHAVYAGEIEQFASRDADGFARWQGDMRQQQRRALKRRLRPVLGSRVEELATRDDPLAAARRALKTHFAAERRDAREEAAAADDKNGEGAGKAPALEERLAHIEQQRRKKLEDVRDLRPTRGAFDAALAFKVDSLDRLLRATLSGDLGLAQLRGGKREAETVVAALGDLTLALPAWLARTQPGFLLIFGVWVLALWGLLGGAVTRSAALEASEAGPAGLRDSLRFAVGKWGWFVAAPLMPLALILLIGVTLAIGGLLYNVMVLDVIGAVLTGLALVGAGIGALLLIGLVAGWGLLHPAVAVEGTDAFDAVPRAYSYVFARPWRWLGYNALALAYGAATFLFVGLFVFLTFRVLEVFASLLVFQHVAGGGNKFGALFPSLGLGSLPGEPQWGDLGGSGKAAAAIIVLWVYLLVGLVAAYVTSFFCCAQTWIYLLLRRVTDGVGFDDVFVEQEEGEELAPETVASEEPAAEGASGDEDTSPSEGEGSDTDAADRPGESGRPG